jgi:transcriptional regulator with XRE-family HTH domain
MPRTARTSKRLGSYIRRLRGDRTAKEMAEAVGLAHSRWRQVEGGEIPPADTLWEIAVALGATASDLERLFELADLSDMFSDLTRIGTSRRPDALSTAEAGVRADSTLTRTSKAKALDYLTMLRATQD